ncbi:MAG: DUF4446 family protein [Deltaproteobacteria bacterium]
MDFLYTTIQVNVLDLIVIAGGIFLIFIISLHNSFRIKAFYNKQERFFKSFNGSNIDASLNRFLDRVEEVYNNGIEVKNYCNEIDRKLLKCFQKVGVVRYNAFENVGSDLSFAIALLDANDDGFVMNGVYSRDGTCTYAKPISNGTAKHVLSAEEMQAIDLARKTIKTL